MFLIWFFTILNFIMVGVLSLQAVNNLSKGYPDLALISILFCCVALWGGLYGLSTLSIL